MVLAGSGLGVLTSPKSEVRSPEVLSTSGSAGNERRRRGGLPCKKGGCDLKISQEVARGSMTVRVPNHKVRNRAPCLLSQSNIQVPDPESDSSTVGQVERLLVRVPVPKSQVPSPKSGSPKSGSPKSGIASYEQRQPSSPKSGSPKSGIARLVPKTPDRMSKVRNRARSKKCKVPSPQIPSPTHVPRVNQQRRCANSHVPSPTRACTLAPVSPKRSPL